MELRTDTPPHVIDHGELGTFITERHLDIAAYFLSVVRLEVPAANGKTTTFVLDHLPQILQMMGEYIASNGSESSLRKSIDFAMKHAKERLQAYDYTGSQIRREYAIVREGILNLQPPKAVFSKSAVNLFSNICELTLAVVIETFTLHKNQ